MVASGAGVGDGQSKVNDDLAKLPSRILVYDRETGSLRYPKFRTYLKDISKAPQLNLRSSHFEVVNDQLVSDYYMNGDQRRVGSGDSSPTCVIQNSATRSSSSSPTTSTISKASSEPGKTFESDGSFRSIGITRACSSERRESSSRNRREPRKTGDACGSIMQSSNTSKRSGVIELSEKHTENASSRVVGKGWLASHDTSRGKMKEITTAPLKPFLLAVPDRTDSEIVKKKKKRRLGVFSASKPTIIVSKSPRIFTFNTTYVSDMEDFDGRHGDCTKGTDPTLSRHGQRNILTPLLKPIPSKWDDAEKWIHGSDKINSVRATVRSGPPLPQLVARQGDISTSWKSPSSSSHSGTCLEPALRSQSKLGENSCDNAGNCIFLKHMTRDADGDTSDLVADEKETSNPISSLRTMQSKDRRSSPDCTGSFLMLGTRVMNSLVESSPATKDVGTAMTPIASVEPSRAGTPTRTPGFGRREDSLQVSSLDHNGNDAKPTNTIGGVESMRVLTKKELQEKMRLEIVALGTQLGKVNIAAWAARDEKPPPTSGNRSKAALEVEHVWTDAVDTEDAAKKEPNRAELNSRFHLEQAKIQKWEVHENTKAEAEMRSVEIKAEHMLCQAHEKLANKLASLQHQAETLRLEAETQRAKTAVKAAKKAKVMKVTGKILNFLILPSFCK